MLVGNLNKNIFIIGSVSEIPNTTADSGIYITVNVTQQPVHQQQPVSSIIQQRQEPVHQELPIIQQQPIMQQQLQQQSNKRPLKKKQRTADGIARINARRRTLQA